MRVFTTPLLFLLLFSQAGCLKYINDFEGNGSSWFEPSEPSLLDPTMGPGIYQGYIIGRNCNETKLISYILKDISIGKDITRCDIIYFTDEEHFKDMITTITFTQNKVNVKCKYYSINELVDHEISMVSITYYDNTRELYSLSLDDDNNIMKTIIKVE